MKSLFQDMLIVLGAVILVGMMLIICSSSWNVPAAAQDGGLVFHTVATPDGPIQVPYTSDELQAKQASDAAEQAKQTQLKPVQIFESLPMASQMKYAALFALCEHYTGNAAKIQEILGTVDISLMTTQEKQVLGQLLQYYQQGGGQ